MQSCDWCGVVHPAAQLCQARPKWGRRGFLALCGAGLIGAVLPGVGASVGGDEARAVIEAIGLYPKVGDLAVRYPNGRIALADPARTTRNQNPVAGVVTAVDAGRVTVHLHGAWSPDTPVDLSGFPRGTHFDLREFPGQALSVR